MNLNGMLFFPVTPFTSAGAVDADALAAHVSERVADGAACVFAACGTGEFHTLSVAEHRTVTATAVSAAANRVPVFVGIGGAHGIAKEMVTAAADEGASGILLMPPYLVSAPQAGLIEYVRTIAALTELPVIVYQRGEMKFTPASVLELTRIPNVIGLKDGGGNISHMQMIVSAVRASNNHDFLFFNGLPTAELTMRAYRAIGVPLYSSAVFAFAPDIALAFQRALDSGDDRMVDTLLSDFFIPFVHLRDREVGFQVSLVKAATTAAGRTMGGVRPPLVDPTVGDRAALADLLDRVRGKLTAISTAAADLVR